jgi:DNA-binding MarR family transcriptional regulator
VDNPEDREQLLGTLGQQMGRRMSTAVVMFHQAVAEQFGMNATDFKCGDILSRTGPITAGELARLTGLETGTLTTVIDRLERNGFARRRRDPLDRRKVIVEPLPGRGQEVGAVFDSITAAMSALVAGYSEPELARILEFVNGMIDVVEEETRKLRAQAAGRAKGQAGEGTTPESSP